MAIIHNFRCTLRCSFCDNDINQFERYLRVGAETICEDCVNNHMEEFDPEGDYIDYTYDLYKER